jgi:hypothetical protein
VYLHHKTAHDGDLRPPDQRSDALTIHLCLCTEVTDGTLARLAGLTQLQAVIVRSPHVTDAGLVHLAKLQNLKTLQLLDCSCVTRKAVSQLQQALPDTKIWQRSTFRP